MSLFKISVVLFALCCSCLLQRANAMENAEEQIPIYQGYLTIVSSESDSDGYYSVFAYYTKPKDEYLLNGPGGKGMYSTVLKVFDSDGVLTDSLMGDRILSLHGFPGSLNRGNGLRNPPTYILMEEMSGDFTLYFLQPAGKLKELLRVSVDIESGRPVNMLLPDSESTGLLIPFKAIESLSVLGEWVDVKTDLPASHPALVLIPLDALRQRGLLGLDDCVMFSEINGSDAVSSHSP